MSWQLFNTALQLALRRGDYPRAFAMAERARATSVTEQRRANDIPSLAEVQRRTRPDQAIVVINQFDDEVALWVIRNTTSTVVMQPVSRIDAERLITRQQEEIRLESARPAAGGALFDALVRPIASQLSGAASVTFVPDTTYQDLSFAGLWDRGRSRYLVEDWFLSSAPSVSMLTAAARGRATAADRALFVAEDEAAVRNIANAYPAATIAAGAAATRARFLNDVSNSNIVHVAMPTRTSAAYPMLSGMTFADEPGRRYSGIVLGNEIANRQMSSTRLVVLDEVRTAQSYQTAGTLGLARAFLAAGVPAVVGTVPGADESATRDLIAGFHREIARQASSAEEALTRVQRNALQQNGRRLGAWTALVIYGSDR